MKKILFAVNFYLLFSGIINAQSVKIPYLNTQRIITSDNKVNLIISNPDVRPWLFHSWGQIYHLQDNDNSVIKGFVFPEIARLSKNSDFKLSLTIPDSNDVESLYWLNIRFIPEKMTGDNLMTLPVHYKIKVFYRPPLLSSRHPEPCLLEWKNEAGITSVINKSSFYFSLVDIEYDNFLIHFPADEVLAPGKVKEFKVSDKAGTLKSFKYIDDKGEILRKSVNCTRE